MSTASKSRSREIHAKLGHPVIDADGHQAEFVGPLEDYVKAVGGGGATVSASRQVEAAHLPSMATELTIGQPVFPAGGFCRPETSLIEQPPPCPNCCMSERTT